MFYHRQFKHVRFECGPEFLRKKTYMLKSSSICYQFSMGAQNYNFLLLISWVPNLVLIHFLLEYQGGSTRQGELIQVFPMVFFD